MGDERSSLEMDALIAHLDRGWDLLHRGDLEAARVAADHILKLEPDSAEGHTLLGAIAAAEGDSDEALELFQEAMDLDPEYLDAVLYAAELAIHPLGDIEYALQLCDEAAELASEPEPHLDVQLLRAEAQLAAGHTKEARAIATELVVDEEAPPGYSLRAGRILAEVGEGQRAVALLERAVGHPDLQGDAHYYLGLALEHIGRYGEALEHLLQACEIDRELPEPEWAHSAEEFEQMVRELVAHLPPDLAPLLRDVPVLVLDAPGLELIADGFDPRGLVYFAAALPPAEQPAPEGRPADLGRRARGDAGASGEPQLVCVFVYKRNLERFARSASELPGDVLAALRREVELFFAEEGEGEGEGDAN